VAILPPLIIYLILLVEAFLCNTAAIATSVGISTSGMEDLRIDN
jgi:hypothetical protein